MGMYINPGNVRESDALLRATWDLDEETVAAARGDTSVRFTGDLP